jgi:hypothetical protein
MNNDFSESIVSVTSNVKQKSFGTGFVIHQDQDQELTYLLTCAHVIDRIEEEKEATILASEIPAEIVARGKDQKPDLAVLQVKGKDLLDKPALKLRVGGGRGNQFVMGGYWQPSTTTQKRSEKIYGTLGKESKFDVSGSQKKVNAWALIIKGDDILASGYSGSPIIDQAYNCVIGVAIEAEAQGNKGTAISIEALKEVWTDMPDGLIASASIITTQERIPPSYDQSYKTIIEKFSFGLDPYTFRGVIPFLGAGVNLCDPPQISPIEMVSKLAQEFDSLPENKSLIGVPCSICPLPLKGWPPPEGCPLRQIASQQTGTQSTSVESCPISHEQQLALAKMNLRLLVQYLKLRYGQQFYQEIHRLFNLDARECKPNRVHRFFATLPDKMRNKGYSLPYQLLVTTNYDEMLESAFLDARQPFDLVFYVAEDDENVGEAKGGENVRGRFRHKTWEEISSGQQGKGKILTEQDTLPLGVRPIILKLYGTWTDKFVITEEHHINYLSSHPIDEVLKSELLNALTNPGNDILLLGYSLNDGDLELIMHRFLEARQPLNGKFWIVHQSKPGSLEEQLWNDRKKGDLIESSLEDFIANLDERIKNLEFNPN